MTGKWLGYGFEDLVLVKTFTGLKFQHAILQYLADKNGCDYRPARADEESQNIDGYVGDTPYSVKPESYKVMADLPETINVKTIYYDKKKDGIVFDVPDS